MSYRRCAWILRFLACTCFTIAAPLHAADWLPVTPEELQLTSEPKAPGAAAIILYRQVDRDDTNSDEHNYTRIKILTEEGRKYADVEILYVKGSSSIHAIEARTIRPDGSIVNFDGTVYDRPIVKGRGVKYMAKTFTLPEAAVGSIIEYRYRLVEDPYYVFDSHWILSQELFTRRASFSLTPSPYFPLRWVWPRGMPEGTADPRNQKGRIRLETHDVPAFVVEEYMPPEDELKYRVDFVYLGDGRQDKEPADYWKHVGKDDFHRVEKFVDRRKSMDQAVKQIVDPGDSAETRLRKIYARVQTLRNLTYEREKTEEELKRDRQKEADNVEDVWNRGAGSAAALNYLFVGLARAAGLEADIALVSTRDRYFFDRRAMDSRQMNSNFVVVDADGKEWMLDPGVPFTPFGMLPWYETAVDALRLNILGGEWMTTRLPAPGDARTERKAVLKLGPGGTLSGKLTVRYSGLGAQWRRLEERNEDEADRRQFLEDQIHEVVPVGVEVKLTNAPDWTSSEEPLVAEFDLKVPGWAAAAGQRQLLKVGLFGAVDDRSFAHQTRSQPIYFNFPVQYSDDISIELPSGSRVASIPKPQSIEMKAYSYVSSAQEQGGVLRLKRDFMMNMLLVQSKFYDQIRQFFQTVRTSDEDQVVISPSQLAQR